VVSDAIWVLGVAMTPFGNFPDCDVVDLGSRAALDALDDASVSVADLGVIAAGCHLDSVFPVAQRVLRQIGQTGIPAYNVTNACATGATALRAVMLSILAGEADLGLAVGVETMANARAILAASAPRHDAHAFSRAGRYGELLDLEGLVGSGSMPAVFAQAGIDYTRTHPDVGFAEFARVAEKNHAHATLNPLAQFRDRYTLDEIMASPMISYPNTLLMCCPTGDGAAAAVLVSEERLARLDPEQRRRAVKIRASVLTSDPYVEGAVEAPDFNTLTRLAADRAYEVAGLGPEDLDLVELHDCFATAELLHYENLRLCEPGDAGAFLESGAPWRDGSLPVNVSGGLISKGHPVGATGIANVYEVVSHLRGEAGDRQIPDARIGLTHVVGNGSACAVHIFERRATWRAGKGRSR
jgi:acetyl-CoA acetyltransferase